MALNTGIKKTKTQNSQKSGCASYKNSCIINPRCFDNVSVKGCTLIQAEDIVNPPTNV